MLQDLLNQKKCFKLVCGAGNEDTKEIEKLITIYSLAGANFFDVCANPDVVDSAKNGLKNAGITKDRYLCISVGIEGDPHITKAKINPEKCTNCALCENLCPHQAINNSKINEIRCIGCEICKKNCPNNAIYMETKLLDYNIALPKLIEKGIDCIEFHAISKNTQDVFKKWEILNKIFDKTLCISVDRSTSGDKDLIELVREMVKIRKPYSTIIQADGVAMSGNDDEYGTTLQAVATAQMFQNTNIEAYIMMSGGTNTKSTQLAKLCGVHPHCVAVGSYARKIVNNYLEIDNLLQNKTALNEAVKIAKNLIDKTFEYMQ